MKLRSARAAAWPLVLAVALAGCPGTVGNPSGVGKSKAPGKASPSPTATASPGTKLKDLRPSPAIDTALPTTRLAGTVALDRSYVLGADGGGFISDQGGGLIAKGAPLAAVENSGTLISDKGGSLLAASPAGILSNHAAGVVANNGGSLTGKVKLLSDKGGGVVANNGGGLVSNNGGGVVANNGGGLVSNNGGGVVANNGGGYRLFQATGPAPVGGMIVAAYSLALGGYLPIGKDAEGNPVWATYTDKNGRYTFDIPQGAGTNVMIVASAPNATDRRLAVDIVVPTMGGGASTQVNARTTVVSAFLRRAAEGFLEEALGADPCRPAPTDLSGLVLANVAIVADTFAVPAFQALPPAGKRFVIARVIEQALATVSLTDLTIVPGLVPGTVSSGPALPVLEAILGKLETATAARLATNPRYFDSKQYVLAANLRRRADQQLQIRTPEDIGGFIVEVYLATSDTSVQMNLDRLLLDLGLDTSIRNEVRLAGASVLQKLVLPIAADESRARSQAYIAETSAEAQALITETPGACPTMPPLAYDVDVTTIAGGTKGFLDGPGAQARFLDPVRLVVDASNRLIVSEDSGHRVRMIDLADPTHPVRTIAGTGEAGDGNNADGPAATATFMEPWGLALGGPGELFVADADAQRIRKISGYDGAAPIVSTIAGTGALGFLDGAANVAQFNFPTGLTRGPDGLLYIVDEKNLRIRRLRADGAIETVAGSGLDKSIDGLALAAAFNNPRGAAFGPDGGLYIAETGDNHIRRWGPEGVTTYAGTGDKGTLDGASDRANFASPSDLAWLPDGAMVVADSASHLIRLLDPFGRVYTLAGGGPWRDKAKPDPVADGPGANARFNQPSGLAVGADGTLYVADTKNYRIRAIRLRKRG